MCSAIFGGDSPHYEAPQPVRIDPAPTAVQSGDVEMDNNRKKKDNRRRAAMTRLSTDRDSILGGLTSDDNTKRDKLG